MEVALEVVVGVRRADRVVIDLYGRDLDSRQRLVLADFLHDNFGLYIKG